MWSAFPVLPQTLAEAMTPVLKDCATPSVPA